MPPGAGGAAEAAQKEEGGGGDKFFCVEDIPSNNKIAINKVARLIAYIAVNKVEGFNHLPSIAATPTLRPVFGFYKAS